METEKFQTGNVVLLSFTHFIHDIYTSFLSPLLPLLIEKLSITLGQAGLLSTLLQIPSLLNPFIGVLADRKGLARWLVILTPTTTAIPMCLMGSTSSYWLLLILFFIAGTSVALFHVPAPVLVSQISGRFKGRGMSFFMTGGETARTLGPLIAVGIVSLFGLELLWIAAGAAILTSTMLYLRLGPLEIHQTETRRPSFTATIKETRPILGPLAGILTSRAFMHSAMAVFLPVYIKEQTGNLWIAGSSLVFYEAMGVLGVLSSGTLSDRFGRKTILWLSLVSAPVMMFIFITSGGILRFVMLLGTGFAILSTTPVMLAIVQENCTKSPAAANGLFMMISFVVRSLTIIVVGVLGDFFGLESVFILCSVAGLGAMFFLLKLNI